MGQTRVTLPAPCHRIGHHEHRLLACRSVFHGVHQPMKPTSGMSMRSLPPKIHLRRFDTQLAGRVTNSAKRLGKEPALAECRRVFFAPAGRVSS